MALQVNSIRYCYHHNTPYQVQALDGISFRVKEGEILGIIGPTGSGKSCLLRCLAGILSPASGGMEVGVSGESGLKVGLVIQEPECQFFLNTVEEEVGYPLVLQGKSQTEITIRVREVLDQLGYTGNLQCSPFHLSGDQQRRVALADILVLDPEILLLDEPTVGLDATGLEMIRNLISLYRRKQRTVLLVSHDVDFLYQQVDRFLVLHQGKLLADFQKSDYSDYLQLLEKNAVAVPEIVKLGQRKLPEDIRRYLKTLESKEANTDD